MSPWLATALAAVLLLRLNGQKLARELAGFGFFPVEELEDALWAACQIKYRCLGYLPVREA